ncbi:MAG: serine/threonine-protein kinase [Planctomycetota bacterium]
MSKRPDMDDADHAAPAPEPGPGDETVALPSGQTGDAGADGRAPAPRADSGRLVIKGYELIRKLGEGGMGGVFLARQESSGRRVALKVLRRELARDEGYVTRLAREAKLASELDHPNIIRAFETGESNGHHYLVMDYVDGRSLSEGLKTRGSLKEREALDVVLQVARALAYAHSEGVVHRDIKPDNIIIGRDGSAKLADLGLAKQVDSQSGLTQTGTTLGTPDYMSPEQARGEKRIDIRSDIYSLGATLYHLVTGRSPFEGPSPGVVIAKRLTEIPPAPSEVNPTVSADCDGLTRRMIALRPEDRHQTPQELVVEIERILAAAPRAAGGAEAGGVRLSPAADTADGHLSRARAHYLSGDFRQAERAYSAALGKQVDCREAWLGHVLVLLEMGRYRDGCTWVDRALARFKADPELLAAKSMILRRLGREGQAENLCDAALGGGGGALAWFSRGEARLAAGSPEAGECFGRALGACGERGLIHFRIGGAYLRHGRTREALSSLNAAATELPEAALVHFTLGSARERLGMFAEARESYRRAAELAPGNPEFAAAARSGGPSALKRLAAFFRRILGR